MSTISKLRTIDLQDLLDPVDHAKALMNQALELTRDLNQQISQVDFRCGDPNSPVEFREHPLDNRKVAINMHLQKGLGVYVKEKVSSGELIAAFDPRYGRIFEAPNIQELGWTWLVDRVVQIGKNRFLGHHGLAEHLNHSCNPNCGLIDGYKVDGLVNDSVGIVAMRDIQPGEELCWDYAMSENSNWSMEGCLCGSPDCRGKITANRDLPLEIKKKYEAYTLDWIKKSELRALPVEYNVKKYQFENYVSPIDDRVVQEVADFFREIFSNDWKNYAVCTDCDLTDPNGMRFSAKEVYPNNGRSIPLDVIDFAALIPDCPCCKSKMMRFIDPNKTFQKLREKLQKKSVLSILRDEESQKVCGLTFGNVCTLREAFESEEWRHPYAYAEKQEPMFYRDFEKFNDAIQNKSKLTGYSGPEVNPDKNIFLSNCVAMYPTVRGQNQLPRLMQEYVNSIPSDYSESLAIIGEVEKNSRFHGILKKAGLIDVEGIMGEDHLIIFGALSDFVEKINLPVDKFRLG